jgi:hypothetical protein
MFGIMTCSPRMRRRVVCYVCTNVSEDCAASIFRVPSASGDYNHTIYHRNNLKCHIDILVLASIPKLCFNASCPVSVAVGQIASFQKTFSPMFCT